jgi:hypothetical protein
VLDWPNGESESLSIPAQKYSLSAKAEMCLSRFAKMNDKGGTVKKKKIAGWDNAKLAKMLGDTPMKSHLRISRIRAPAAPPPRPPGSPAIPCATASGTKTSSPPTPP